MRNKISITQGFTLVELMIVVAILGIISAIAIPAYNSYIKSARLTECATEMDVMRLAQAEFFLINNAYFPDPTGAGTATSGTLALIEGAAQGIYVPSHVVPGNGLLTNTNLLALNCTYSITTNEIPASFTITATGQNNLAGTDILTKTN